MIAMCQSTYNVLKDIIKKELGDVEITITENLPKSMVYAPLNTRFELRLELEALNKNERYRGLELI